MKTSCIPFILGIITCWALAVLVDPPSGSSNTFKIAGYPLALPSVFSRLLPQYTRDQLAQRFTSLQRQSRANIAQAHSILAPDAVCEAYLKASFCKNFQIRFPQIHPFAVITDKDHNSVGPEEGHWHSILRKGSVQLDPITGNYSVTWGADLVLTTRTATKGRSMELSELVQYRHLLLAFCDSTGMVWKVNPTTGTVLQRYAIADGDGEQPKPFKSEWATVKDGLLWVGSMGRPYVDEHGTELHRNSEWVKTVDENGRIENHDWGTVYDALRRAAGVSGLGYLWHEGVHWDDEYRRWVFLPRKRSATEPYSEKADETRGTNILVIASEDFSEISVVEGVGPAERKYGFSTVRKVPGSSDVFMAVKVKEIGEDVHSKLTIFDLQGQIRLDSVWEDLGGMKFEGLEFTGGLEAEAGGQRAVGTGGQVEL